MEDIKTKAALLYCTIFTFILRVHADIARAKHNVIYQHDYIAWPMLTFS